MPALFRKNVLIHFVSLFVCRYYEFDHMFAREVLGKKLSKGTKKDLDDISSKTGIALKSCRRQVHQTIKSLSWCCQLLQWRNRR